MPVEKFRDLDAMNRALWMRSDDPRLPDRARRLMAFSQCIAIVHAPPGVRRFRTIEESNADREAWPVETRFKPDPEPPG